MLPGVADLSALVLVAAVDPIKHLNRVKQLTSHCAIMPTVQASGEPEEQVSIMRQGRRDMRALWIQAANSLVRSRQPNAQPFQRWFSRVAHRWGLRTALAAVPLAILSTLMFCPGVLNTLTSISVTPKNQNISTGQTQQYTARGTYGYASTNHTTNQVTWSSSSTSVATINSSGLATAVAAGTTTISAMLNGKTGSASLTVSNPAAGGVFCGGNNGTATLPNCDPNSPNANTVFDTTMPDTSAYAVVQVNSGGDLQGAINGASCGTVIKLQAGATFAGQFNLPNKTCAAGQWIIIQSDSGSIPAPGTRVSPSDAANMPKIQATGGLSSITVSQKANHYRFIGVEFNIAVSADTFIMISLDAGAVNNSQLPAYIVFDRCYLHGNADGPAHQYTHGIDVGANFFAVIDSYLNQFHDTGADSQTMFWRGYNAQGPFKIVNNYLSASGENTMSGGAQGLNGGAPTPSDFEFRRNHFFKPLSWRGTPIVVKNLFELKDAQRVLVDGNVFENTWAQAQDFAIVFTPSADSGPNAVVQDVTFTHNIVRHAPNGIAMANNGGTAKNPARILFQNNLFADINNNTWGTGDRGWYAENSFSSNIVHDHNTVFESGTLEGAAYVFYSGGGAGTIGGFQFTNNIISHGVLGFADADRGLSEGLPTLNSYVPARVWNKNVIINGTNLRGLYPAGTFFAVPNQRAVKFVSFSSGDYHLSPSSPYKSGGTDGKDIGADIDSINSATAGVIQVHD